MSTARLQIIISGLFAATGLTFGQDTTTYCQADASLFSNCYSLIRVNKNDFTGIFYQRSADDVGQYYYGMGTFRETRRKLYLTFDRTNHARVEMARGKSHNDTLFIKWFDCWGNQQVWFSIRYVNDTVNNFFVDLLNGYVKIPKSELKSKEFSLLAFSSTRKVIDFEVSSGDVDTVKVFANDPVMMHSFSKRKEILRKTDRGIITYGEWIKRKKVLFTCLAHI